MKCKFKTTLNGGEKYECPRDAEEGGDYCFWHNEEDGKNLEGKDLRNKKLMGAYLKGANLQEAHLGGPNLQKAHLEGPSLLEVDLEGANLQKAYLEGANLQKAILWGANLQNANLIGANLKNANLIGANLQKANLIGANLQKANLWRANIQNANLIEVNLQKADLLVANLQKANLFMANLQEAELVNAYLLDAELSNANLQDANLYHAKIEKARNLQYAKLDVEVINERDGDKEKDSEEKLEKYNEAHDIYITLKNYFRKVGRYDLSGKYFIRECRVKGKIDKLNGNYHLYFANRFLDIFSEYGESPQRVLGWSVAIVGLFAFLYFISNAITPEGLTHNPTLAESIYFSIVTFTTLGYGDFHPKPAFQLLAAFEAFIGMFIMAFFTITVARKIMR